jgi:hypothetical protein
MNVGGSGFKLGVLLLTMYTAYLPSENLFSKVSWVGTVSFIVI